MMTVIFLLYAPQWTSVPHQVPSSFAAHIYLFSLQTPFQSVPLLLCYDALIGVLLVQFLFSQFSHTFLSVIFLTCPTLLLISYPFIKCILQSGCSHSPVGCIFTCTSPLLSLHIMTKNYHISLGKPEFGNIGKLCLSHCVSVIPSVMGGGSHIE